MIWYKVTYKPFNSNYIHRWKVYNEVIIFLATENLIFFTDYMLTWDHHWGAGWIFIIIISSFLLLHFVTMLLEVVLWLYLFYLRFCNYLAMIFKPCTVRLKIWWHKHISARLRLCKMKVRAMFSICKRKP